MQYHSIQILVIQASVRDMEISSWGKIVHIVDFDIIGCGK